MPVNRLISCLLAFVCLGTMFESASAQSPWRTRYVRRDGLFHVEKYRTGNGITPAFAGVLSTAVETFGPIAASLIGREAPPEAKTRDLPSDWLQQYTVEQRRANDLLERTAMLVKYYPPVAGPSDELSGGPTTEGGTINQTSDSRKHRGIALTIGLNNLDPTHYVNPTSLRGCVNDARDVLAIAREQHFECFEPLIDENATRTEVVKRIRQAAKELKTGDTLLLHYSGHGSTIEDQNGDEADRRDETWCLYDGMLLDDELNLLWAEFQPGVRILVLSDSCHSGTVTKTRAFRAAIKEGDLGGRRDVRGVFDADTEADMLFRYFPDENADKTVASNKAFYKRIFRQIDKGRDVRTSKTGRSESQVRASVLLISGCQDNQVSGDLPGNGVFTAAVKRTWRGGQFTKSWRAFHAELVTIMPQTQTPNFYPTGVPDSKFWDQRPFTF